MAVLEKLANDATLEKTPSLLTTFSEERLTITQFIDERVGRWEKNGLIFSPFRCGKNVTNRQLAYVFDVVSQVFDNNLNLIDAIIHEEYLSDSESEAETDNENGNNGNENGGNRNNTNSANSTNRKQSRHVRDDSKTADMKDDESRSGTNYIDDENEYDDHVLYIHRLTLFCHHIILGRIGAFLRIPQSVRNNAALSKLSTMTMPSQSAGAALTSIREESKSNLTNGNSNTFNEFQQQQQKQQQQQQQEQDNDKDNYDEQKEADDITPSENNDNDTDNDNDKRVQKQVQFDSSDLIKAHDQGSNSSINSTVVLKNSESNDNHSVASYASSSMSYLEYNKMTCLDLFQLQWQEIMTSNLLGDASAMEMNVSAISHASHTSLSQGSNSDDSINNDNVQKQIGAKSMDRAHSALSQNSHISQHSQTDSTATGTGSGTMTTGSSGASDSIATPVPNSNAGSGNILVSPPFPNLTPTTPRSELGISPQSPYNKPPVESLNLLGLTQQKSRIGIEMTFRRIYFIYLTNFINRLWNDYHSNETSHYSKKKQRHNNSDESKDEAKDEAKEDKNKEKAKENNVNNNDNENLEEKEFVDTTSAMIDELVKLSGIDDCSPVFYKIAHFSLQLGKVVLDDLLSVEAIEKKLANNFDWFLETVDENHANHVDCGPQENFVTFVLPDVEVSGFGYH